MEHSFDKCSRLLLLLLRARSAAHLPGAQISTVQSHGQRRAKEERKERIHTEPGAEPKTKPHKSCTLALLPSNLEADAGGEEAERRKNKSDEDC